jgi:penicillin-binding protein 1A
MASRSKTKDQRPFFMSLLRWAVVIGLWGLIALTLILAWYAKDLPDLIENPKFKREASITVLGNDGTVIARYGDLKGNSLSIDDMPQYLIDAILATEDRRFYYHFGIDPIGLMRAFVVNFRHGDVRQGGSTITQQLAKNLFLSQDRTYKRKIQEALLALWLEKELTKDEILAAYLNRVYMGSGAYGVDAAAEVYFNKSAKNINLREAAILAGLLRAPSRYSPNNNPKAAEERAKVVVGAMVDAGYLTKEEAKTALKKKSPIPEKYGVEGDSARYFADWIVDNIEDHISRPQEDIVIETTLDPDIQTAAAKAIDAAIAKDGSKLRITQGAAVVMRPDGRVVALVGGRDYRESQYNRATQGMRQPGSSFKPIVYLAALEAGFGAGSLVDDAPYSINGYSPQNFGNKYYGTVTLTDALTLSLNTVAVRLAQYVGVSHVIDVAKRMGISAKLQPNLSLALGSNEIPMVQMAQAYTIIANGGFKVQAFGIENIKTESGKTLYQRKETEAPRVFRGSDIDQLTSMMRNVVLSGTGAAANSNFFVAGKTGTSQDYRDAWFDAFTTDFTAVVWFGNDNNTSMKGVTGGSLPARTWKEIITAAKNDPTPGEFALKRDYNVTSEFGDVLSRITGSAMPSIEDAEQQQNSGSGFGSWFRMTPHQGTDGDSVGYERLNN